MADAYVVSNWVKDKLGMVTSVKVVSIFLSICLPEEAGASRHAVWAQPVVCFALRSKVQLKGVINGVSLRVEVDQIEGNMFDFHCLVRRRGSVQLG